MEESTYRLVDIVLKVIGILGSMILAIIAWGQFSTQQEKQFHAHYYQEKIKTINTVIDIVERVDFAETNEEKKEIVQEMWTVHFARSWIYFSPELFKAMDPLREYTKKCIYNYESAQSYSVECTHGMVSHLPGFSLEARKELTNDWKEDLISFGKEHPIHPSR